MKKDITLCMLGNFVSFFSLSAEFFKILLKYLKY